MFVLKRYKVFFLILCSIFINNYKKLNTSADNSIFLEDNLTLLIEKINLMVVTDKDTTLDTGIEIHEISLKENAPLVISGHSGIGDNVYFNELFALRIDDEVIIIKNNLKYVYFIEKIVSFKKGSKLQINNSSDYLYLVTCDLLDMQKQWIFSAKLAKIAKI